MEHEDRLNETESDSMSKIGKGTLISCPSLFAVITLNITVPRTAVTQMGFIYEKLCFGNSRDVLDDSTPTWSLQKKGHAHSMSLDKYVQLQFQHF